MQPPPSRYVNTLCASVLALVALVACRDVTHERIDGWLETQGGPERLQEAASDPDLDAALRAHAARNLLLVRGAGAVLASIGEMEEGAQRAVVGELAPRLFEDAALEERMQRPSSTQKEAKDALFELRAYAGPETKAEIDEFLTDWLAGGYYEGRAQAGRISGQRIVRAIGVQAAPALLAEARHLIAQSAREEGTRLEIGDRLLAGLVATGSEDAVAFLLDLVTSGATGDDSLPARAMRALERAYLEPPDELEPPPRQALHPHLDRLASLARAEAAPAQVVNSAVRLLGAAGSPECIEPLAALLALDHDEDAFRWMVAQHAVRCGGADALSATLARLPEDVRYRRGILERYVWKEALEADSRDRVGKAARELLGADSWVARVSGVELLGMLAIEEEAEADAGRVRELAADRALLLGWDDGPSERAARDPKLSERATEVAQALEKVAK